MILARRVALAKWGMIEGISDEEALRLAMDADLRVENGQLSLWQCGDGGEPECSEVALALAAAMNHLSGIQLVLLREERLQELGMSWQPTKGRTPIVTLQDLHLTAQLGEAAIRRSLALEIRRAVADGRWRSYSRSAVKTMLVAALSEGRLESSDLSQSVWTRIRGSVLEEESR